MVLILKNEKKMKQTDEDLRMEIHQQQEEEANNSSEGDDIGDVAYKCFQKDLSFFQMERELKKRSAIGKALEKIGEGTYGLCDGCGSSISDRRLKTQPWANLCISCANEQERNR